MERNRELKPSVPEPYGTPELVPSSEVEDAIITMLRMFHPTMRITSSLLHEYLATCEGIPAPYIYTATKDWLRHPPENRAARAHELRDRALALMAKDTAPTPAWQQTARPTSAEDLDRIFADLAVEHPHNRFLQELIRDRARARAQGQPRDGAAESGVLLNHLARGLPRLPPGPGDGEDGRGDLLGGGA